MTITEYKATFPDAAENLKPTNLVFLLREGELLLAMKKRGFGAGRWNGAGGKVEPGETVEQSVRREALEEIGVTLGQICEVAMLKFHFAPHIGQMAQGVLTTVYICKEWTGEPAESEEMAPYWYKVDDIPFDEMWPDDRHWLPRVLEGDYVDGEFLFGEGDRILDRVVSTSIFQ